MIQHKVHFSYLGRSYKYDAINIQAYKDDVPISLVEFQSAREGNALSIISLYKNGRILKTTAIFMLVKEGKTESEALSLLEAN